MLSRGRLAEEDIAKTKKLNSLFIFFTGFSLESQMDCVFLLAQNY